MGDVSSQKWFVLWGILVSWVMVYNMGHMIPQIEKGNPTSILDQKGVIPIMAVGNNAHYAHTAVFTAELWRAFGFEPFIIFINCIEMCSLSASYLKKRNFFFQHVPIPQRDRIDLKTGTASIYFCNNVDFIYVRLLKSRIC